MNRLIVCEMCLFTAIAVDVVGDICIADVLGMVRDSRVYLPSIDLSALAGGLGSYCMCIYIDSHLCDDLSALAGGLGSYCMCIYIDSHLCDDLSALAGGLGSYCMCIYIDSHLCDDNIEKLSFCFAWVILKDVSIIFVFVFHRGNVSECYCVCSI